MSIEAETPNPSSTPETGLVEALREAREAITSLDEDALGSFVDPHTGEPIYTLRAELLAKIDTALSNVLPDQQLKGGGE